MSTSRIEQLKGFLESTPHDSFLKYALALEYIGIGELAEAEALFKSLIAQHPDYLATYYHYGKLLEHTDRYQDALIMYSLGMTIAENKQDAHSFRELREAHSNLEIELQ